MSWFKRLTQWLNRGQSTQVYVGNTVDQLFREQVSLKRYGNQCIQDCATGLTPNDYLENLAAIAELYIQGYSLNFNELFTANNYRRIPLPTYPFDKQVYWVDAVESQATDDNNSKKNTPKTTENTIEQALTDPRNLTKTIHPLLHENLSTAYTLAFAATFSGQEFFIRDHQIDGKKIVPGVVQLEMAAAAMAYAIPADGHRLRILELSDIAWLMSIVQQQHSTQPSEPIAVTVTLYSEADERMTFAINQVDSEQICAQGVAVWRDFAAVPNVNLATVQQQCQDKTLTGEQVYQLFSQAGIEYGPGYRAITSLFLGKTAEHYQVLAELQLPEVADDSYTAYTLHPSLVDAALQATVGFDLLAEESSRQGLALPFATQQIQVFKPCPQQCFAWLRPAAAGAKNQVDDLGSAHQVKQYDIDIVAADGSLCIAITGFALKTVLTGVSNRSTEQMNKTDTKDVSFKEGITEQKSSQEKSSQEKSSQEKSSEEKSTGENNTDEKNTEIKSTQEETVKRRNFSLVK